MSIKKHLTKAGIILASLSFSGSVLADSQVQNVIDESYVQPDYVLGYSLSDSQKQETLRLLNYQEGKDTDLKTLNTSSYAKIMDVADDPSLQLYSSVKIKKLGASKTLNVNIVTPENITKVTEDMYRNAAVTLGIQHADIEIAAPIPVTGESALAGIYYSLEKNGAQVPDESKDLAQEELNALSDINQENQGKEGFDADKLNVALTDIKAAIAQSGKNLTKEDVQKIVEDTLDNYNLKSSMTENQINLIVNFAVNLSNSGVISNGDFVKTLSDLKDSIISKANGNFKGIDVNFDANKAIEQGKGIWQQIVDFFKKLIG
ncbi:DUF1002 domain-containing protein [Streptococcus halotolerans]|uniref:DUF1002 domain-containing protein n=1 Tax=Streptococcus halotolerans TaxID=1814128 RepID=UPI0007869B7E|nr:DUF1002 domain-containing protein [Streptococcus halotolerans]